MTPLGVVPTPEALDVTGLDVTGDDLDLLLSVDRVAWEHETDMIRRYFVDLGPRVPDALWVELAALADRLR